MTLGLDLSIRATGIAVFDGERIVHHRLAKTPGPREATNEERMAVVRGTVLWVVRKYPPHFCAIEGPAYARANQMYKLGELGGVIKYTLWNKEVAFVEVPPSSLKKYATGNGRADKVEMTVAAQTWVKTDDHNIADAVHLARYAYEELVAILDQQETTQE